MTDNYRKLYDMPRGLQIPLISCLRVLSRDDCFLGELHSFEPTDNGLFFSWTPISPLPRREYFIRVSPIRHPIRLVVHPVGAATRSVQHASGDPAAQLLTSLINVWWDQNKLTPVAEIIDNAFAGAAAEEPGPTNIFPLQPPTN